MNLRLLAALWTVIVVVPSAWGRSAESLYIEHCSGCHGLQGDGGGELSGVPDFRGLVGAFAGIDAGRTYLLHVPGVANATISSNDIAQVLNYVMARWGGKSLPADYRPFTAAEVIERRSYIVRDVVGLRREVVASLRKHGLEVAAYPWP